MKDIHTHIIPNVDDGSPSLDTSINMIKHEIDIGVTEIICTPHHIYHRYEASVEVIKEKFNLLKEEVEKLNLPIKLYLGQEICYTHRENILGMLKAGKLLTLNNTNRVLLEFSFTREPEDILDIIYNFNINGYEVIIAHVERYEWMNYQKVVALRNEGALIQINSNSYLGLTTWKEKRFVKKLLKKDLVDYVASDTHSFRPSTLDKSFKKIKNPDLFNYVR
jgi:protein-tyrosine phosphatase